MILEICSHNIYNWEFANYNRTSFFFKKKKDL